MLYRIATTIVFHVVFIISCTSLYSQKIATLEVTITAGHSAMDIPVHFSLDAVTSLHDSLISLQEINGRERKMIPYQLQVRDGRELFWVIRKEKTGASKKTFELIKKQALQFNHSLDTEIKDGALTISNGNRHLLRYQYGIVEPPAGVAAAFRRGGFIHPLWTPHGQELTRVSPPDHYHHFGLWNPWTKVLVDGDTTDFWNLGSKQGTVRFAEFVSVNEGPVYSDYQALHEHVVFKKSGEEKVAFNELQSVRIYQPPEGADYYIMDISIRLNTANATPVILKAYRYGGLGWRATAKWNKDNSETITSEGKNRREADGSKARWCIVQGKLDEDYGGIVMMSSPANFNHPEPLRIWPENSNGTGDVFANFSPTKDKDWLIDTGKDYLLKYRLLVFNGRMDMQKAEAAWQDFAQPPVISIKINN